MNRNCYQEKVKRIRSMRNWTGIYCRRKRTGVDITRNWTGQPEKPNRNRHQKKLSRNWHKEKLNRNRLQEKLNLNVIPIFFCGFLPLFQIFYWVLLWKRPRWRRFVLFSIHKQRADVTTVQSGVSDDVYWGGCPLNVTLFSITDCRLRDISLLSYSLCRQNFGCTMI